MAYVGDTRNLTIKVYSPTGQLVDPTVLELSVQWGGPTGAWTTYTWPSSPGPITHASTGVFTASVTAAAPGTATYQPSAAGTLGVKSSVDTEDISPLPYPVGVA